MQELTYVEDDNERANKTRKLTGGFNSFPPGWRGLTEEEFSRSSFFHYYPIFTEYRQMLGEKRVVCAHLFHGPSPGEGVAIRSEGGKIHYYAFGCDHKWTELTSAQAGKEGITHFGMCDHIYKCEVCGATKAHDSSD
jgi:hypothetical protein